MVILAELGHVINVNKARQGIKCYQNKCTYAYISVELKIIYRKQDLEGFFHQSEKYEYSYCHYDSLGLIPTICKFGKKKRLQLLPLEVSTD